MISAKRSTLLALLCLAVLVVWYGLLLETAAHAVGGHPANQRVERTERYGDEAFAPVRLVQIPNNGLLFNGSPYASGSWQLRSDELGDDLERSRTCNLTLYVSGLDITSATRSGVVAIEINGRLVKKIVFSKRLAAYFPVVPKALVPDNVTLQSIENVPLFRAYAVSVPLGSEFCRARQWTLKITATKARWAIERVGLIATFTPEPAALLGKTVIDALAAILILGTLLATVYVLLRTVARRYGLPFLGIALLIVAISPLTHDQWDFSIWLRFVDLVAFGHGNPARIWFGTPLWAFTPSVLAPVLTASYAIFGNGSQDLTVILLKAAMALAFVFNALTISGFAPRRLGRLIFTIALMSPIALYQLGAGYREVFAAAFVLAGLRAARDSRLLTATFLCSAGASISETLLPFVVFPAALELARRSNRSERVASLLRSAMLAATGVAFIALQWILLIPHDFAHTAFSSRIVSYRYGGGSWYAGLDSLGLLPSWVGPHSLEVVATLFLVLAAWPAVALARALFVRADDIDEKILRAFVGFVIAIFLSYRGIDPSTWYALFCVVAAYYAIYEPTSPLPLLLGTLQGLTFYAILGIGDFVNWTFLWPHDRGLLGILGRQVGALAIIANAMTFVIYLILAGSPRVRAFSRMSPWFLALFFAAVANSAIRDYPMDVIFCFCVTSIVMATAIRMMNATNRRCTPHLTTMPIANALGFASSIGFGAFYGASNGAAGLAGSIGVLLGAVSGFGLVDIVVVVGGSLMLSLGVGFGYFSILGWALLSLLALFSIYSIIERMGSAQRAASSRE